MYFLFHNLPIPEFAIYRSLGFLRKDSNLPYTKSKFFILRCYNFIMQVGKLKDAMSNTYSQLEVRYEILQTFLI